MAGVTHTFEARILPVLPQKQCLCPYDEAMSPHSDPDERRWHELLSQLDPEALTDALMPLVREVDGYGVSPIPQSEIRRTAVLSLATLLAGLRGEGRLEHSPVPVEIGVSRARAGVALSALMTAIRLDFSVIWDALIAAATPSDAQLIVRHTRAVMRTVDDYVGQAQRAYLAEAERMRNESASIRRELIDALVQGERLGPDALAAAGTELGIPADRPLLVAAAVRTDIAALRVCVAELERRGVRCHTAHLDGALVAFLPQPSVPFAPGSTVGVPLRDLRVGLTTAPRGLSQLCDAAPRARALALLLLPDESGAMTWERGWARHVSRMLAASTSPILGDVDAALATSSEAQRERLVETVRRYLVTGSISETARALFCHRNTVSKQLQQFRDLTGVDPTIPSEAARLVVGWA